MPKGSGSMVYVDSNVFVYAVTHDPRRSTKADRAVRILREVEEGRKKGVTSFLTWDEGAWVVWKLKGREAGVRAGSALLRLRNLSLLPVSGAVMVRAQQLLESYELKPRDAIHISSALLAADKEIVSDDSELDSVREITRLPLN
jgi:predicted nucleic acid-binding protein